MQSHAVAVVVVISLGTVNGEHDEFALCNDVAKGYGAICRQRAFAGRMFERSSPGSILRFRFFLLA
jgi:hypothetical protein